MGSHVSAIVANLCMEVILDSAIASPKIWKRFFDNTFAIINKNATFAIMNN